MYISIVGSVIYLRRPWQANPASKHGSRFSEVSAQGQTGRLDHFTGVEDILSLDQGQN